jgi:hypothetical protein
MKNDTKIKALMKQIESGEMKTDSAKILDFIINEKFSSRPLICDALSMLTQTATGRLNDLQDYGIIEVVKTDLEPEYHIYTYQSDPMRQIENAYYRKKAKFIQWQKRGKLEFYEFLNENQLELNI